MPLPPTPSQTVGPFFAVGLPYEGSAQLVSPDDPEAIRLAGVVYDGAGAPVNDALLELWQANRAGRYDHPEDTREEVPLEPGFRGFGRCSTDDEGRYGFVTVKPGAVPAPGGGLQAPHLELGVFARGLLKRLATRVYFPDEIEANAADPVLSGIPDADLRATLVARPDGERALRFDVHIQGDHETAFFAV